MNSKDIPKEVDDDGYSKIIGQYRFKVRELIEPLRMYGQEPYCNMVEEEFVTLAVQLHLKLCGIDIPYSVEKPHW